MSKWESIKYAVSEAGVVFVVLLELAACYVIGMTIEATILPGLQELSEAPPNALTIITTRILAGATLAGSICVAYAILDLFFIDPIRTFARAYKEHQSRCKR